MDAVQIVPVHIVAGALSLLSGAAAAVLRKSSPAHVLTGKVFVASMLLMSGTGAIVAFFRPEGASVVAGLLTFYAVLTG